MILEDTPEVLYTLGYQRWPARVRGKKMLQTLVAAGVNLVVDVRHSPCPTRSQTIYPWHLHTRPRDWAVVHRDIEQFLAVAGIGYEWMVELGNPMKQDPGMSLLRAHLECGSETYPVNRGLARLAHHLESGSGPVCLLCACRAYDQCHRKLIAGALNERWFEGRLQIVNLSD